MKILHLSDLHICSRDTLNLLKSKLKYFRKWFSRWNALTKNSLSKLLDLELEHAHNDVLQQLKKIVRRENPNVIVITGDITTFGDKSSFDKALNFVMDLREKGINDESEFRPVVVVPGNHDVACHLLSKLISDTEISRPLKWFFPGSRRRIDKALGDDKISADYEDPLVHYESFKSKLNIHNTNPNGGCFEHENGFDICISPFESISLDPCWFNLGQSGINRHQRTEMVLRTDGYSSEDLGIVLLHHNPISSPDEVESNLVNAMNSMPSASSSLKAWQDKGIDLVLFGHQHQHTCCQMDFIPSSPGHMYLLGATSAAVGNQPGFNMIEIESRFVAETTEFKINTNTGSYEEVASHPLIFEKQRVDDAITVSTSREIRHYRNYDKGKEWKEMLRPGAEELFLVGPRQSSLTIKEEVTPRLDEAIKSGTKVNILITDPDLYDLIDSENIPSESRDRLNQIWSRDREYSWENQSSRARETLKTLKRFRKDLEELGREDKIEVCLSHTLMSIGARGRNIFNADKGIVCDDGALLIRILPVGIFRPMTRSLIRLEKRHNEALYMFYATYIKELWSAGKPVKWDNVEGH